MSEQSIKDKPKKLPSWWARITFYLSIFAFTCTILAIALAAYDNATVGLNKAVFILAGIIFCTVMLSLLLMPVLILTSVIILCWKRRTHYGLGYILLSFLLSILALGFFMPQLGRVRTGLMREMCERQISEVGTEFIRFCHEHNNIVPAKEMWFQTLIDNEINVQANCPAQYTFRRIDLNCYALNENLSGKKLSEFAKDTVLFFETSKPCENPYGNKDSITAANHRNVGCNIVFCDGTCKFVLVADFNNLKW